jgi:hypothetical protein
MASDRDLVSRTARNAVRGLMSELAQAAICEYWENEHFAPAPDFTPGEGGVRKRTFDSYAEAIDWSDKEQTIRALRVFESLLRRVDRDRHKYGRALDGSELVELREAFAQDSCRLDDNLRLHAPATKPQITAITRRRIIDALIIGKVWWWGSLDEVAFLERLYDLDTLESHDPRYATARDDIIQHCISNDDWDANWVFDDERFGLRDGSDETYVTFLAEMLHPAVRRDEPNVQRLLGIFNKFLAVDGFELYPIEFISGLPVFTGVARVSFHGARPDLRFEQHPLLTEPRVLHEHQQRIRAGLNNDPAAAIASCKELTESLCKIILDQQGVTYPAGEDLPPLYKRVAGLLALDAAAVPDNAKASETVKKILRTLTTTVQSLAELRNQLGLGHGRTAPSPALARHARLALNSTVTVTEFLLDTWQDRIDRGLLEPPAPPS